MAGSFDGANNLTFGNLPNVHFLFDAAWTILLILRPTKADQTSQFSKWSAAAAGRQIDVGTDTDGLRFRLRHDSATAGQIEIAGAFTLGDYHAVCVCNNDSSACEAWVKNLRTGTTVNDTGTLTGNESSLNEPINIGNRNATFPIFFEGDVALAAVLDRVVKADEFELFASRPREAIRVLRNDGAADTLVLYVEPGMTDAGSGDTVDFSSNHFNATTVGAGIPRVDGPPSVMQPRRWKNWAPSITGPPPTFVPAWAKQSTIGAGFETAA